MAFIFPEDKADFTAQNGITYTYKDGKWMIKSYGEEINLSPYVLQDIFDADQSRQDSDIAGERSINETQDGQINALETQIQLLAQVKATGTWTYERNITTSLRPPNLKKFYGTDVDDPVNNVLSDWGKLRLIMISKTSVEDKTFTFNSFEEGDKVEILSKDGTSLCIGTVTNDPNAEAYGNFVVTVEYYKGGPVEGAEYLFSAYRPGANSGDVDLDILDQRYLQLTGGTLSSSLKVQRGEEKTHPQFKISPNGGTDYATNVYTLEGQMRFRTTHNNSEGDAKGSHIVLDPDVANDGANPTTKIWKVATPTSADMAANRQYVDDKTDGLATETYVDNATNGLASETYVDNAVAGINVDYKVPTGTNTNPSLAAGEMYLNTQNNVLYIGK